MSCIFFPLVRLEGNWEQTMKAKIAEKQPCEPVWFSSDRWKIVIWKTENNVMSEQDEKDNKTN